MNIEPTVPVEQQLIPTTNTSYRIALFAALGVVVVAGSFIAGAVSAKTLAVNGSPSLFASVINAIAPTTTATATISVGTDNPGVSTLQANATAPTTDVTLHTFTLTPKDGDAYLHSLVAQLSAQPNATSSAAIIRSIKLYAGTTLLDTEAVYINATTTSVKFQNLNLTIPSNTTQSFRIVADINPLDGKGFVNGAGIAVSVRGTDVELGTSGASCAGKNFTVNGSTVGNLITFMTSGISADPSAVTTAVATASSANSTQQIGTFTFTFNVTAFGQDIYVPSVANSAFRTQLYMGQDTGFTVTSTSAVTSTADRSSRGNFVIHAGQTKKFTVTITALDAQNQTVQAGLLGLNYGTSDASPATSAYSFPSTYLTSAIMLKGATKSLPVITSIVNPTTGKSVSLVNIYGSNFFSSGKGGALYVELKRGGVSQLQLSSTDSPMTILAGAYSTPQNTDGTFFQARVDNTQLTPGATYQLVVTTSAGASNSYPYTVPGSSRGNLK